MSTTTPCECGGEVRYYDGALGYEAMVCESCGEHWADLNVEGHRAHVASYNAGERNNAALYSVGDPVHGGRITAMMVHNGAWYCRVAGRSVPQCKIVPATDVYVVRRSNLHLVQLDVCNKYLGGGLDAVLRWYGDVEYAYMFHWSRGQLCRTQIYGTATDRYDSQLDDIQHSLDIEYSASK